MSQETREALAQRIRSRLSPGDQPAADHDVSIVGGGAAALTLALEIRRARPTTRILIIEPNAHPVPEITHTVGESTVEVSAHYLRDRLGLGDHLRTAQHPQDGPADVLLERRKHRYRAADGTRKFLVRPAGDLPDRPRQAGKRAPPALPGRRRRDRLWPSPVRRVRREKVRTRSSLSERRRRHADDGTVGGRRVGPQPGAAPATGSASGPTNTIATPPGSASRPRSTSADGVTTRTGGAAWSRATARCPPIT